MSELKKRRVLFIILSLFGNSLVFYKLPLKENLESNADEEKQSPLYGVSGLYAGWYDRVETNKDKLWYWGGLRRWIAYITAYLRCLKVKL